MSSHDKPILVLGATGTTGRRLVDELLRLGEQVRAASRHPASERVPSGSGTLTRVAFDWYDTATHDAVLAGVRAVYVLAPPGDPEPAVVMTPFVRRAVDAGVERLVVHSSSAVERGGPGVGQVHEAIAESGVGWAAVRPTWFMQNLWNPGHPVGAAVRDGRDIVTATGSGRIPFIDATDIARVAAQALTGVAVDGDLVVTGPEALSYDDVATKLTRSLGRPVRHRAVDAGEATDAMAAAGIPVAFARMLAGLEEQIARGTEDRVTDTVERCTGAAPRSLDAVLATDDPYTEELA